MKELVLKLRILGTSQEIETLQQLKDSIKENNIELSKTKIGTDEFKKLSNAIADATALQKQLTSEQKNQVKAFESLRFASGSYKEIQASVSIATDKLKQMSVGLNATQEEFDALKVRIQDGKVKLADFDRELSASNQLIGEYDRGIIKAFKDLGLVDIAKKQLTTLEATQQTLITQLDTLQKEYQETGQAGKRSADLVEGELKQVVQELTRVNASVDAAKKELTGLGSVGSQVAGGIVSGFKDIGATLLIGFGAVNVFNQLTQAVTESIHAFEAQQVADEQLRGSLVETGEAAQGVFSNLKQQATDLQKISIFSDDNIQQAQKALATFGLTGDRIAELTPKIVDFASRTKQSLSEATNVVLQGLSGQERGLKKYGLTVGTMTQDTGKNFESLSGFLDKFSGATEELANTAEGRAKVTANAIEDLTEQIGQSLLPLQEKSLELKRDVLETVVPAFTTFIEVLSNLPRIIRENAEVFILLATATGVYYANTIRATGASIALSTVEVAKQAIDKASAIFTVAKTVATNAYGIAIGVLNGQIKLATAIQFAWNAAQALNPIGLTIAAIGAVAAALVIYSKNTEQAIQLEREKKQLSDALVKANKELDSSLASYSKQIENYNNLSREQREELKASLKATLESAQGQILALELQQKEVGKTARQLTGFEEILVSGGIVFGQFVNTTDRANEAMAAFNDPISEAKKKLEELKLQFEEITTAEKKFSDTLLLPMETLGQLEKRLSEQKAALKDAVIGSQDEKAIKAQIKITEGLIAEATGEAEERRKKEQEKKEKEIEDNTQRLVQLMARLGKNLADAQIENIAEESTREIAKRNQAFEEEKQQILDNLTELNEAEDEAVQLGTKTREDADNAKKSAREQADKTIELLTKNHEKEVTKIQEDGTRERLEKKLQAISDELKLIDEEFELKALKIREEVAKTGTTSEEANKLIIQNDLERLKKEKELIDEKVNSFTASTETILSANEDMNQELLRQQQELNTQIAEGERELSEIMFQERENRFNNFQDKAGLVLSNLGELASAIGDIFQVQADRQIDDQNRIQEEIQVRIDALQEKKNSASDADKIRLDKEIKEEQKRLKDSQKVEEQIKKDAARKKKAIDITSALITGAVNAITAYGVGLQAGFPQGLILAPVLAALSAAFTAIQVGIIAATPLKKGGKLKGIIRDLRKLASGGDISNVSNGFIPRGSGMIVAPRHSSNGVKFQYQGRDYEAEGGELKTNNGKDRYIFTRGVGQDATLRKLALATHGSSFHPGAKVVASMVNQMGGGRSFMSEGGSLLQSGASLSQPLPQPNIVLNDKTNLDLTGLINSVNASNQLISERIDQVEKNFVDTKIAVPVDEVTDIQTSRTQSRQAGLF
jgi:hypothetical protein